MEPINNNTSRVIKPYSKVGPALTCLRSKVLSLQREGANAEEILENIHKTYSKMSSFYTVNPNGRFDVWLASNLMHGTILDSPESYEPALRLAGDSYSGHIRALFLTISNATNPQALTVDALKRIQDSEEKTFTLGYEMNANMTDECVDYLYDRYAKLASHLLTMGFFFNPKFELKVEPDDMLGEPNFKSNVGYFDFFGTSHKPSHLSSLLISPVFDVDLALGLIRDEYLAYSSNLFSEILVAHSFDRGDLLRFVGPGSLFLDPEDELNLLQHFSCFHDDEKLGILSYLIRTYEFAEIEIRAKRFNLSFDSLLNVFGIDENDFSNVGTHFKRSLLFEAAHSFEDTLSLEEILDLGLGS